MYASIFMIMRELDAEVNLEMNIDQTQTTEFEKTSQGSSKILATSRIFNSPLGVWKCGQRDAVFCVWYISVWLHYPHHWGQSTGRWGVLFDRISS